MEPIWLSWVYERICYLKEVNDINDFEGSKFGGTIEWEKVFKFLKNLKFFLSKKFLSEI
tara:strand:- start:38 stop:214 length:177 start_codon:yes stop_codon:yes gene_type:complete